jgi:hypothetical protein
MSDAIKRAIAEIDKMSGNLPKETKWEFLLPLKGEDPEPYVDLEMVRRGWARVYGSGFGSEVEWRVGPKYPPDVTPAERIQFESDYRSRRERLLGELRRGRQGKRDNVTEMDKAVAFYNELRAQGDSIGNAELDAAKKHNVSVRGLQRRKKKLPTQ